MQFFLALAHEFPELVFVLAEENFIRGYELGLDDAYKGFTRNPEKSSSSSSRSSSSSSSS